MMLSYYVLQMNLIASKTNKVLKDRSEREQSKKEKDLGDERERLGCVR